MEYTVDYCYSGHALRNAAQNNPFYRKGQASLGICQNQRIGACSDAFKWHQRVIYSSQNVGLVFSSMALGPLDLFLSKIYATGKIY